MYHRYLRTMGRAAGRLFAHDHVDIGYAAVLEMTKQHRGTGARKSSPTLHGLPDDSLIVLGRLGEQFEFIRCSESEDPPVWYFEASGGRMSGRIKKSHRSVSHWLETWCA